jgi:YfiH family protein
MGATTTTSTFPSSCVDRTQQLEGCHLIERRLGAVRAIWTDRHGGVSAAPFDTANLSDAVGDSAWAVAENRRAIAQRLGLVPPDRWQWLRQVHGTEVARVDQVIDAPAADAAVTTTRGLALAVIAADCAPIALATDDGAAVVHAGWRGLAAGVVEAAVDALRVLRSGPVRAVIGPCICARHYEFGRDDLESVVQRYGGGVVGRTDDGRMTLDLVAGVGEALMRAGVDRDAIEDLGVCTYESAAHYSHRRDAPTGRQALVVVLEQ